MWSPGFFQASAVRGERRGPHTSRTHWYGELRTVSLSPEMCSLGNPGEGCLLGILQRQGNLTIVGVNVQDFELFLFVELEDLFRIDTFVVAHF